MSDISVVIVSYQMGRELPRTLYTLGARYQRDRPDSEIIVVDNGSPKPPDATELRELGVDRFISITPDEAKRSPAAAANRGLRAASGDLIGLMVDGARMASPGLLKHALAASSTAPRPIVATYAYHLGETTQMEAVAVGFDQAVEDRLLATVDWRENGYSLFSISSFAGSSHRGWFGPMGESNALFMPPALWDELGGMDEAFDRPGGGLANHDLYRRACELEGTSLLALLGEGTFHQYHGGAATGGTDTHVELWSEYESLRGRPYRPPDLAPVFYGSVPPEALRHLRESIELREGRDQLE
jgi:glycosyltransferase involved in cell wall biosynthesis